MDQQGCKDSIFLIYPEIWSLILLDLFYNEIIEPASKSGKMSGKIFVPGIWLKMFSEEINKIAWFLHVDANLHQS